MFLICAENSVDNAGMFSLLPNSPYTVSRPCLLLTWPHQRADWGPLDVGRGCCWDSWPQLTKGVFHTVWHHAQPIKLGEEEGRGGTHLELWHWFS